MRFQKLFYSLYNSHHRLKFVYFCLWRFMILKWLLQKSLEAAARMISFSWIWRFAWAATVHIQSFVFPILVEHMFGIFLCLEIFLFRCHIEKEEMHLKMLEIIFKSKRKNTDKSFPTYNILRIQLKHNLFM